MLQHGNIGVARYTATASDRDRILHARLIVQLVVCYTAATAFDRLPPPSTAFDRLRPPSTAFDRLRPPSTATAFFTPVFPLTAVLPPAALFTPMFPLTAVSPPTAVVIVIVVPRGRYRYVMFPVARNWRDG